MTALTMPSAPKLLHWGTNLVWSSLEQFPMNDVFLCLIPLLSCMNAANPDRAIEHDGYSVSLSLPLVKINGENVEALRLFTPPKESSVYILNDAAGPRLSPGPIPRQRLLTGLFSSSNSVCKPCTSSSFGFSSRPDKGLWLLTPLPALPLPKDPVPLSQHTAHEHFSPQHNLNPRKSAPAIEKHGLDMEAEGTVEGLLSGLPKKETCSHSGFYALCAAFIHDLNSRLQELGRGALNSLLGEGEHYPSHFATLEMSSCRWIVPQDPSASSPETREEETALSLEQKTILENKVALRSYYPLGQVEAWKPTADLITDYKGEIEDLEKVMRSHG